LFARTHTRADPCFLETGRKNRGRRRARASSRKKFASPPVSAFAAISPPPPSRRLSSSGRVRLRGFGQSFAPDYCLANICRRSEYRCLCRAAGLVHLRTTRGSSVTPLLLNRLGRRARTEGSRQHAKACATKKDRCGVDSMHRRPTRVTASCQEQVSAMASSLKP